VAETGQPYAYTGDDPVNDRDPKGLEGDGFDPYDEGGFPYGEEQEMEHGGAQRDVEQVNEDLNSLTVGDGQTYETKAEARSALIGDAGSQANKFFKGATSKSIEFKIAPARENGGYRLSFYSPANNPGYGKLYVQEISANGDVESWYKDTLHGDQVIERKYIPGREP
jgi:hypothetical protein